MRVGIIQSCYIPWRGYFDFIKSVDLFLLFDDVQYPQGRSWRNRNQLKTKDGLKWLTVPVSGGAHKHLIEEVRIAEVEKPWQLNHRRLLQGALQGAPFADDALALWEDAIAADDVMLSALNSRLIHSICRYLTISTPIVQASQFKATGHATERLISLLKAVNATTYISGPVAKNYLDDSAFRANNLRLEYKSYDYAPYPQLWGPFEGAVSVLDLIANLGPQSIDYVESKSPNIVAVA